MYKQDILLKVIEDFFTTIRIITKLDIEIKSDDFEQMLNDLFYKTFGITSGEIAEIDIEKHSSIIYDEKNKIDLVYLLLKSAKYFFISNPKLSKSYVDFSKSIWLRESKTLHLYNESLKNEIEYLFSYYDTILV